MNEGPIGTIWSVTWPTPGISELVVADAYNQRIQVFEGLEVAR